MVCVEKYLIDIYDKVPLLGAIALFIPLCGDVDHISDAMRCGPFVAKYMRKVKIRRLLLVFFKYLRCTLGQRTVHRGWDWNISGTRRSLWPTKNCPTMSEMRPMMKMAAHKNVLLLTSCGLFRPGGKHAWIYGTWQTQKKTKYSSYLQCSLNKIGADIFVLATLPLRVDVQLRQSLLVLYRL